MERRFQVFISSTFLDLQPARQEVSQALLRAGCFPAGMELFPAADEEQLTFIKQIIDESDYYIIISAGRYGSVDFKTGLSYTELEYDYAIETGKPVIRLLHKDPFNKLAGEFIEKTDPGRRKLTNFRTKLSKERLVRFWSDPKELGVEVVFALSDIKKRSPTGGWTRASETDSSVLLPQLQTLRNEVATFKRLLKVSGANSINVEERVLLSIGYYERLVNEKGGNGSVSTASTRLFQRIFITAILRFLNENPYEPWGAPVWQIGQEATQICHDEYEIRFHLVDHSFDLLLKSMAHYNLVTLNSQPLSKKPNEKLQIQVNQEVQAWAIKTWDKSNLDV